jgi:molybdopterin-guanine dinucleotide biosynthesis protein A
LVVTAPSTGRPPGAEAFGHHAVDPSDGNGPLQGLRTALESTATALTAVVTVDMPRIDTPVLQWLVGELLRQPKEVSGLMCRREPAPSPIEPFPSVFRKEAAEIAGRRLQSGRRSVHGLCDDAAVTSVVAPQHWPREMWLNLNHPEQLAAFLAERGTPDRDRVTG